MIIETTGHRDASLHYLYLRFIARFSMRTIILLSNNTISFLIWHYIKDAVYRIQHGVPNKSMNQIFFSCVRSITLILANRRDILWRDYN